MGLQGDMRDSQIECEYLIVGAGAAGCVVASRLSEDPNSKVVLIEAGGADLNPLLRIPATGFLVAAAERYNWSFSTEPCSGLNNRRQLWLAGKVLGGSTTINGMAFTRGHAAEYDRWRDQGCIGWGYEDVLPFFRKMESNFRGASPLHGGHGPIKVRQARYKLPISDLFLESMAAAGFPVVGDLNDNVTDGFGYHDLNIGGGMRMSTARAYLKVARKRSNLLILTNTEARRVVFRGRKACGMEVVHRGAVQTIKVRREIILSAGGINSPRLLMLSGVGPAEQLKQVGVTVVIDRPQVGKNLQNHPLYRLQYSCSQPVTAYKFLNLAPAISAGARYLLHRTGFLADSYVVAGGTFRSEAGLQLPDVQIVFVGALLSKKDLQRSGPLQLLPRDHGFALSIYQGVPFSRGYMSLRSNDPADRPSIFPNYFSDPRDIKVISRGIRRMRQALSSPVLEPYIKDEVQPGTAIQSDEDLENEIRRNATTAYHQCGTCAMGGDPSSVLDPTLKVRGVDGLRVADGSIIPTILNANMQAPIIMIGEKAAALIRNRH